jgi:hypothetical protein
MFSTNPKTGKFNLRVNDNDFRVSFIAVAWGVEMRIDVGVGEKLEGGRSGEGRNNGCRWVSREMCSSEVPG